MHCKISSEVVSLEEKFKRFVKSILVAVVIVVCVLISSNKMLNFQLNVDNERRVNINLNQGDKIEKIKR